MKHSRISLLPLTVIILFIAVCNFSCKKEPVINSAPPQVLPPPLPPPQPLIPVYTGSKVFAGPDQWVPLPANFSVVYGNTSHAASTIESYFWKKISGPALYLIENAGSRVMKVTNLEKGTYEFELTVTTKAGSPDKDTVSIHVYEPRIAGANEFIFKNLVWTFPWYNTLEVKNIYTYIATGTPIKVFVQRDNASEWKEAFPESNNVSNVYEYYIETRPNGNGFWTSYGSLYIFYFGRDTDDTPDVKIQF